MSRIIQAMALEDMEGEPVRISAEQLLARFPLSAAKASKAAKAKKGIQAGDTSAAQAKRSLAPENAARPLTALQKACEKVAHAPEGERDDTLNKQAFFIAQRIAGGLLSISESAARQALAEAARQSGLEEGEISATLDSAFSKGMQEPVQSYDLAGGHIEYSPSSVWFVPAPKKEGQEPPAPLLLARQLEVVARTYNVENQEGGILLQGKDAYGKALELFIPADLPMNENALAQTLAKARFQIEPLRKQKELLAAHIHKCPCERLQRLSSRLGWHNDTYLLPDKAIAPEGSEGEGLMYRSHNVIEPAYSTQGTLEEWRQQIAAKAQGNSKLILALCTAFAAPLLKPYGTDRGGFLIHLRGGSSTGKTTALNVAASVYGKPSTFAIQWRATSNALEGIAESRNDGLLALDEVGQARAKDLEPLAYMLANGRGKERSNKNADNRAARHWRNIGLSTGERSYSDIIGEDGKHRARAGQELRFLDNEADAGKGYGLFDHLAGQASAADLSRYLNASAKRYHGTAGEAFLQCVANEYGQLEADIAGKVEAFAKQVTPEGADGQAYRAAAHFGLLAAAGELASKYGITGWQTGEASEAIATCFAAWLEGFGTGNKEQQQALSDIRTLLAMHGASRFDDWEYRDNRPSLNRLGYTRDTEDGDQHFIVLCDVFEKEICKGHNYKNAIKALQAEGALIADKGKTQKTERYDKGGKNIKTYCISARALGLPIQSKNSYSADHAATAAANEPVTRTANIASAKTATASQVPRKADSVQASSSKGFAYFERFNKLDKEAARLACNPTDASLQSQRPLGTITITSKPAVRFIPKAAPPAPPASQALDDEPPDAQLLRQEHQRQIMAEAAAAEAAHADYL